MASNKDDKFIMMNLDDSRSKKVAEAISNPTCKKLLDYLAENNEKSEEDISKDLGIPINTVEYNLKKLLEAGLVDKTKNFFWSKRGKKISLYKLAKKHIVISPKSSRPNLIALKTILPVIVGIAIVAVLLILLAQPKEITQQNQDQGLQKFLSMQELKDFLKENSGYDNSFGGALAGARADFETGVEASVMAPSTAKSSDESQSAGARDYSETNIQVTGVDEPDIVKNDGKYIYAVSGNNIAIIDAYPAENMKILSEINITNPINIFINEDKLIIFSNKYYGVGSSIIKIYDISDKTSPELEKEIEVNGYYLDARMIENYVYLITNRYTGYDNIIMPAISVDGVKESIAATEIGYFSYPDTSYTFTNILALNINDGSYESQSYLLGSSYTMYVSENNIFLTSTKTLKPQDYYNDLIDEVILPLLPAKETGEIEKIMDSDYPFYEKSQLMGEIVQDYSDTLTGKQKADFDSSLEEKMQDFSIKLQKKMTMTIIHKIEINKESIEYITNGEVPGVVLNQFSMDEYNGNFRIATTTGNTWGTATSLNHLYILDENLNAIGSLEDMAKGEKIYSVRFLGERAYIVTFRQVDPLFVLDLSNPENPEILGQLKVTGYSSYLHPYDENHIIGIGKEATTEGRVQGLKIALFDVSDVENPIELAKYEVTDGAWSDSNALYDHKAFLFDKNKELLVLPVSYSEDIGIGKYGYRQYKYWQGAFVFKINLDEITLRGKIDHEENTSNEQWYYGSNAVQRSLYMDDVLYTISRGFVKANDLADLSDISSVKLPYELPSPPLMYDEGMRGIIVE